MQEHTEKYKVHPERISLEAVPTIYRTSLASEERLDSEHNSQKVKEFLVTSDLKNAQVDYIFAVYLSFAAMVPNIGIARTILSSENPTKSYPALFRGETDRSYDIDILKTLLCPPMNWVASSGSGPQPMDLDR